ncbi:MAG: ABC transporter ATP-binding protein [Erysipelotrichaceae bacterium]|nr:ABC transporter ATP-binding protein [Erysipelotrichaceae bacterium]MBO4537923.1 ABC transporter ATP-binding protein [Erysipelotrichaceae bacterium]
MVRIENLVKNYKDFSLNISLSLPEGRVSGLVGRNGAGKTTTIKAILGLISIDGGTVEVFGKSSRQLTGRDKEKIGVALSDSAFSNYLTGENIIGILKNMYADFEEERFRKLCTTLALPLNKPLKEFSTGMKAKLRVIVAITHKARLLIMDEPTSGLDVEARNEVLDVLRNYLAENEDCSIIISSHISSDLESMCDDIYLINDGKIILHEDTDKLLDRYGVLKVDEETFKSIDRSHIIASRGERFGYSLFTDEKQYYKENYPALVVENGSIDDLILIMAGGERL